MMYLDYGLMAVRDDQGRIQPMRQPAAVGSAAASDPLSPSSASGLRLPADALARDVTCRLDHLIQPERVLGAYVVPSLERAAKDKLDGATVDPGAYVSEKQPEMGLAARAAELWRAVGRNDRS